MGSREYSYDAVDVLYQLLAIGEIVEGRSFQEDVIEFCCKGMQVIEQVFPGQDFGGGIISAFRPDGENGACPYVFGEEFYLVHQAAVIVVR